MGWGWGVGRGVGDGVVVGRGLEEGGGENKLHVL